jgi:hypothetical protein
MRKLALNNVEISLSGTCPLCRDLLLTPPMSSNEQTFESAQRVLERVFQNHQMEKHFDAVQRTVSATDHRRGELA